MSKEIAQFLMNRVSGGSPSIVILTVYRKAWEPYIEKYIAPFKSLRECLFTVVLGDKNEPKSIIKKIEQADILIIGGGNTSLYHKVYCKSEIRESIQNFYNDGNPVIGFSAGALIMGEDIVISPHDNDEKITLYKSGIGIYHNFIVGVHYTKWNDFDNLKKAKRQMNNTNTFGIDDNSYVIYSDEFGFRFLGSVYSL